MLFYNLQFQVFLDYLSCLIPLKAKLFTSLMVDLRQDINGTFFKRNYSVKEIALVY